MSDDGNRTEIRATLQRFFEKHGIDEPHDLAELKSKYIATGNLGFMATTEIILRAEEAETENAELRAEVERLRKALIRIKYQGISECNCADLAKNVLGEGTAFAEMREVRGD